MKHLYILLTLFSSFAYGQFTLNSSYNYQTGTTYRSYDLNSSGISAQGSGASQTWDYSGFQEKGHYDNQVLANTNSAYSSANIVVKSSHATPREYYFQTSSNSVLNWGYKNTNIGDANYTGKDAQLVLSYPMNYGDAAFNDNISGNGQITYENYPFQTIRTGTVSGSIDGYGSLKLPQ